MHKTRWNVTVSTDIDRSLRLFLINQGRGKKGDLSSFVEDAVRAHIKQTDQQQRHGYPRSPTACEDERASQP